MLERLQDLRAAGAEIIVVDGGSADQTTQRTMPLADQSADCAKEAAAMDDTGAKQAQTTNFLFLHADTQLPPVALAAITLAAFKQGAL